MKILAIVGSARKGNSFEMVKSACSVFGGDAHLVDLSGLDMHFCSGCLSCDETKQCNIDDDMSKLLGEIATADAFIFASPIRWSLLSGELKTFFDRLNPFATTGTLSGKKCIIFVVGQSEKDSEEAFSIDNGLASVQYFCENAGMDVVASVKAFGCLQVRNILQTDYLEECRQAARILKNSIE